MPRSLGRRARVRLRALGVAVMLLMLGMASGTPPVAARSDQDAPPDSAGCGDHWSSAELIDTLDDHLLEVSGFVSSARYPGLAWMIRDSQNPDSLYSFRLAGDDSSWKEFPISGGTSNRDWEDVTYTVGPDGRGRLWILENDFAGSDTQNASMKLYEVLEPDPDKEHSARLAATYRFEYPDEEHDTEALFVLGGRLLVVSKTSPNRVFQFPSSLSRSGTNHLVEVGGLDASSLLTAVGTSGDERLLVTIGIADDIRVFENRTSTAEFSAFDDSGSVFHQSVPNTQREAIDFFPYSGCNIVSVSEDGTVWRLSNPREIHPHGLDGPASSPPAAAPDAPADPPADPPGVRPPARASAGGDGYWMLGSDGAVYGFGHASDLGNPRTALGGVAAVDLEPTPSGGGYWVVDAWGGVFLFGDARFFGEIDRSDLGSGEAVTSLSRTPAGDGYWIFTSRGRVVPFGAARSFGDMTKVALNGPVLDSVATPTGLGYYMVAADGGIFSFGDARFFGSMGGKRLNAPVQSLVPDADGAGYWLVASDGGVFAFDAPFGGSLGDVRLNKPITGMVGYGSGYLMVGEDGGIFNFSDQPFSGSLGDRPPARPIVSVAVLDY